MVENRYEIRPPEELVEERSFDELAKGLATGAVSRRKALKLMGASIFGSMLIGLVPGAAGAKKKKKRKKKRRSSTCPGGTIPCPARLGGKCCDIDLPLCCPVSTGGGCCPSNSPVCCPDGITCCPAGTTCTAEGTAYRCQAASQFAAIRGTRR